MLGFRGGLVFDLLDMGRFQAPPGAIVLPRGTLVAGVSSPGLEATSRIGESLGIPPTRPTRWAAFMEDKQIYPAPAFSVYLRLSGATAGPGSPGNGSGSKHSAGCTENQSRRPNLRPFRGQIVLLVVV